MAGLPETAFATSKLQRNVWLEVMLLSSAYLRSAAEDGAEPDVASLLACPRAAPSLTKSAASSALKLFLAFGTAVKWHRLLSFRSPCAPAVPLVWSRVYKGQLRRVSRRIPGQPVKHDSHTCLPGQAKVSAIAHKQASSLSSAIASDLVSR